MIKRQIYSGLGLRLQANTSVLSIGYADESRVESRESLLDQADCWTKMWRERS